MQLEDFPFGPFTTAQARELGLSRSRLHVARRDGLIRRVLHGVYVRYDVPDTVEVRAACAALVIAPGSVLRDRTAAWIHGIDVFTYAEHDVLPPLETCVARFHTPTDRRGVDGGTRDLSEDDVMAVHGVLVTTPLRTALDLGCNLHRRDALAALDRFMRAHGLTRHQLEKGALRFFRRRGVVQLRRLIPLADHRAESVRESWTRLEILDAGLPTPTLQYWIEINGVPKYRLDLAYPKHRVAVEYDGDEFHKRTDEQKRDDADRRRWLAEHGWTVVVVGNGDFSGTAPDRWLGELKAALRPSYTNRRW